MDIFTEKMDKQMKDDEVSVPKEFINQMIKNQTDMVNEIKQLKDKFLSPKQTND